MSNLNVWAIQYYPKELDTALNNIKDGINIIYSNCINDFTIGNQYIKTRKFDTVLYNETSDILIMLMADGIVTKEDLIKKLEERNKKYVEITFNPFKTKFKDKDNLPELWFVREKSVLEDALTDSCYKGVYNCEFYPSLLGKLDLSYKTICNEKISIDGRTIKGVIKLKDKIILMLNNTFSMKTEEILKTLNDYSFKTNIYLNEEPKLYVNDFSKRLIKR